jgi:hypothetical protein
MNSIEQNKRIISSVASEIYYHYKNLTVENTIQRTFTFTIEGQIVTAAIKVNIDITTYPSIASIVGYSYVIKNLPVTLEYVNKQNLSNYHELVFEINELMEHIINQFKVILR